MYGSCTHGAVRLVGGPTTNQGRVEVCVGQTWGTVCNFGFGTNDARVVCRQLGYIIDQPGASEYFNSLMTNTYCKIFIIGISVKYSAYYGQGSGPIWLQDVGCKGTEQQLFLCDFSNYYNIIGSTSCNHNQDVGVICPSKCSNDKQLQVYVVAWIVVVYGICIHPRVFM